MRALVTDNFQIRASYAYDRAYTKTFTTAAGRRMSTRALFEAPESTVSLGAPYRVDLSAGGNVTGVVDSYLSGGYLADDFPAQYGAQQYGYTRTNVSLTYNAPQDRWSLGVLLQQPGERSPDDARRDHRTGADDRSVRSVAAAHLRYSFHRHG